jgi:FkbM family methyltransferase
MFAKKIASRILWKTKMSTLLSFETPYGYRMKFHPSAISAAMWEDRQFRREEVELLLSFLQPGDTYVDIGANVGSLALAASVKVGAQGHVYAIEASPRTFFYLKQNIELNHAENIVPIHAAIGKEDGTVRFTDNFHDDMNHVGEGHHLVPCVTLDHIEIEGAITLLKSDTEGYEPDVIAGGMQTLIRTKRAIFECSEWNLSRYHKSTRHVIEPLVALGFTLTSESGQPLPPDYIGSNGGNIYAMRDAHLEVR